MQIRQATIADLETLVPLFDAYRVFYGNESNESLAKSFLQDRMQNLESFIFIAFSDDRAVGFTQLFPMFSSGRAARTFVLNDLFVIPDARGAGIGKALLAAAADFGRAAGAVRLTLSTARENLGAQSLYESAGWLRETAFVSYNRALS